MTPKQDILDYLFAATPEPTAERCSVCQFWFRSEELDFCRACGESACLGCTRTCDCGDKVCAACFAGEQCVTCHGEWLDRRAATRL